MKYIIPILLLLLAIYLNFFSQDMKRFDGQREEFRKYKRMYKG